MKPIVKLDRTLVAVEVDQTVHMMLELVAPAAAEVAERRPIDVVAVIDRSGSMSGEPLEAVLRATGQLAQLLGADDRLAVVTFDDSVDLVLPLAHHDAAVARKVLGSVHSGGSTNLSGGWLKGMEILTAHGRPDALKRVLVLTDGMANVGIVDRDALAGLTSAARGQSVTTSMIGFGDGYDEQLLAAMADAGGGNDYWCAGADQATKVFADEFAGLASVVAQNISVEIRPSDPSADFAVLNEFPITHVPGGRQVALGDAYGDERRRVVAMFEVKARPHAGPFQVAELVIRWASVIGEVALHTVTVPVTVGAADPALADAVVPDAEVEEHVNILRATKLRKEAFEAERQGRRGDAIDRLSQAAPLMRKAAMPAPMIAELDDDIARLKRGDWHERDMKRHYSQARTSNRGRKSRYDDPTTGEPQP